MSGLRRLWARVGAFVRHDAAEAELGREVEAHLALLEEQYREAGLSLRDARHAARRAMGGVEQAKELHREARSLPWLDDLWRDVTCAGRSFRRSPGLTLVAVLSLALGVGATTAVFSVAEATLLRPLPYPDADRLVALRSTSPTRGLPDGERTALGNLADWKAQAGSFEAMTGYRWYSVDLMGREGAERLRGLFVTPGFFQVFGIRPVLGRGFTDEDPGGSIVLGQAVWKRRVESDASLIGEAIDVNIINVNREGPTPFAVLGVISEKVHFPPLTADFQIAASGIDEAVDVLIPEFSGPAQDRTNREHDVVGKLRRGVTVAQAQAEMEAIAARLAESYPDTNPGWGVRVVPLRDQVLGPTGRVVRWLFLSGGIVLLIACGNVASLLLARGLARQREVAIRAALGAGRLRIVRQFLAESLLLAVPATVLGVGVTAGGIALLRPGLPAALPLLEGIGINATILGYAVACAVATALLTAVMPAWQTSRGEGVDLAASEARTFSPGRRHRRGLSALIAAEVALTLILLVSTGLMVRSAARLVQVDPGFTAERLLTMTISLPANKFDWDHNSVFSRQVIDAVEALTPVRGAAVVQGLPMQGGSFWGTYESDGGMAAETVARLRVVSPGYFGVMGIPILSGRDFEPRDEVGPRGVPSHVIVSRALAERYWPGEDAVNRRIRPRRPGNRWMTIAAVVGDVRYEGLDTEPGPEVYLPEGLFPQAAITLLARTAGDPLSLTGEIRDSIARIDRDAFVSDVRSMEDVVADSLAPRRTATWLLITFALVALTLSLIGLSSVVNQSILQRTREIGIRMALGAGPGRVAVHVLGAALRPSLVGLLAGGIGALVAVRFLAVFLFEIRPFDVGTWSMVMLLMASICAVAGYLPARRARRIDPTLALRAE